MRVMIIGASANRAKFGNKAVRAFLRQGHDVLPVNPHESRIEGLRVYRDVADVPGPIDRASFYVPPEVGLTIIGSLAARGDVAEVWLNPGAESTQLVQRATALGLPPIIACSIVAIGEHP
jgi:predicted CoA-binding protein